ncbi:MAG: hypothetical protein IPN24_14660 [Betaproteobacteria bacterium]|nr:hypothetical protein [Betaproteobacteria bacterium]
MVNKADIARALDVDPAMVTRWTRRGMPLYSVEAARRWRLQNIRPRMKPPSRSPAVDLAALADLAADPAALGGLRSAIALLPAAVRAEIELPVETWDALLGADVLAALDAARDPAAAPLTDAEADEAGAVLVGVIAARACG